MKRCEERLKPPPIIEQRKDLGDEISTDPKLKDFDDSKWVFTDITMGIEDKVYMYMYIYIYSFENFQSKIPF